jgi:hypothetical protein
VRSGESRTFQEEGLEETLKEGKWVWSRRWKVGMNVPIRRRSPLCTHEGADKYEGEREERRQARKIFGEMLEEGNHFHQQIQNPRLHDLVIRELIGCLFASHVRENAL